MTEHLVGHPAGGPLGGGLPDGPHLAQGPEGSPVAPGPAVPFSSALMACQPQGGPRPVPVLRLRLPHLIISVEPAGPGIDQYLQTVRKRLKARRYVFEQAFPAEVAGNPDGRGQWVAPKGNKQNRQLQLCAVTGGVAIMITASQASAGFIQAAGPVQFAHPPVPGLLPLVRLPAVDSSAVEERITLVHKGGPGPGIRLAAIVTARTVTGSADGYAAGALARLRQRSPDLAIGEPEPDVFLGGHYCVRRTLLHSSASLRAATQNEFWWAGVVAGRGVQVSALGLNSIIGLPPAAWLRDLIRPAASG